MISKLSNQDVFPVHRMINKKYEKEAKDDAKIVSSLYRPVRWMTTPARRLPKVLLRTAGRRCDPASALEIFFVTRKYRGTENIIYNFISDTIILTESCAAVCKAMIRY